MDCEWGRSGVSLDRARRTAWRRRSTDLPHLAPPMQPLGFKDVFGLGVTLLVRRAVPLVRQVVDSLLVGSLHDPADRPDDEDGHPGPEEKRNHDLIS
jgi:hypothetical protein